MNLNELGYQKITVYYKDKTKIVVCDQGIEKTVDGRSDYLTWDELHALTELNLVKPKEIPIEKPKETERKVVKVSRAKQKNTQRLFTVINKQTGQTVVMNLPSEEAYKRLGLSSVNAFRIIVSNQKHGKPHKKWEIRE